jgi:hypothetical protein
LEKLFLIYEKRPFVGKDREEIKNAIIQKNHKLSLENLPIGWSCFVLDFINSLLEVDQNQRLGAKGIK